ncbi:MAG: DUF1501 domain-containing protein [Pirellulales bacterium]|nr:DUF1501 domain-containing protein [Pirellulales bacterium]
MRITADKAGRYCDGFQRRHFLQIGMAGMGSFTLPELLRAKALTAKAGAAKKDTACILLWLDGGPSHIDLYDPKPDAPAEYRGMWNPIATNVPDIHIGELLPKHAQIADKLAIIRSLRHGDTDHDNSDHMLLTGHSFNPGSDAAVHPSMGSIVSHLLGPRNPDFPAYVTIPRAMSRGRSPGYAGPVYLGSRYAPFEPNGDPSADNFHVKDLKLYDGLTMGQLEDRTSLLSRLDQSQRNVEAAGILDTLDTYQQQAYDLITSPSVRKAFDLHTEPSKLRDQYGRHTIGQSMLLARRMVEAGSTFVTVYFGGWDHHWNLQQGLAGQAPILDQSLSTLVKDLDDRGRLEQTLVMAYGEMGRTPLINSGHGKGNPGRDHWGNAMCAILAGGGIRGGQTLGQTTARGEEPSSHPLGVGDLHATIYDILGIDFTTYLHDRTGRPVPIVEQGEVLRELF